MVLAGLTAEEARTLLEQNRGFIRAALRDSGVR